MIVDFIFDVASPNTYLAHKIIPQIEERTGAKFEYIPCLLGGIHKLSNNQPPFIAYADCKNCLLYTSPSPRDGLLSRMPSSA